jgi:hypothetical protein
MDATFPFGFPWPTAFYLVLYVATLVIHVIFMNYVLAGTGWLAVSSVLGVGGDDRLTVRAVLKDWMPFALSAAITAGVAPILFIQILYKQSFYTANLLLFHRWMAIVPVLIVGFYLLYLLKAKAVGRWPMWLRAAVGVVAFACFAFVAYSWTENHLLSVKSAEAWGAFYGERRVSHYEAALVPRLGMWFIGSVPTMAMLVLWQLWFAQRHGVVVAPGQARAVALAAIIGIVGAAACGYAYQHYDHTSWDAATGPLASAYMLVAGLGLSLQCNWIVIAVRQRVQTLPLLAVTVGVILTILGMTVIREAIRLNSIDMTALYEVHARAAEVGGLAVFLAFFAINASLIVWVFVLVGRGQRTNPGQTHVALMRGS